MTKDAYGTKGRNHLILNTATMNAAMQLWVDTFMVGNNSVEHVTAADNNTFKVQITTEEEAK